MYEAWSGTRYASPGLGDRFKETVLQKLEPIENDATKGLLRKPPYREAIVEIFPYLIIYRLEPVDKQIFVQSIFHSKRNPRKKYTA
jgi:hypothetical protein